jgi:hypothetical protein
MYLEARWIWFYRMVFSTGCCLMSSFTLSLSFSVPSLLVMTMEANLIKSSLLLWDEILFMASSSLRLFRSISRLRATGLSTSTTHTSLIAGSLYHPASIKTAASTITTRTLPAHLLPVFKIEVEVLSVRDDTVAPCHCYT